MDTNLTADEIEPLAHFIDRITENCRAVPCPGETPDALLARISALDAERAHLESGGRTLHTLRDTRARLAALRLEYLIMRAPDRAAAYLARREAVTEASRRLAGALLAFSAQEITVAREFNRATASRRERRETALREGYDDGEGDDAA